MKKIIIILCLSLLADSVMGQAKKRLRVFTEEPRAFLEELNDFVLASPSEEGKKLMKEFSKMWKGETFSSDKKQTIYDISNTMLKERNRPTHFEKMLGAVVAFAKTEKFNSEFSNWAGVVQEMLKISATSRQMKFFAFSQDLFQDNTLMRNRSVIWKTSSPSYTFSMDSMPRLRFTQPITLMCLARGDTLQVKHTEGFFTPLNGIWKGKSGLIDWQKAGYSLAEIYAELSDYKIKMRTPSILADSVLFYNTMLFDDKPIVGKLEDKLVERKKEESSAYPKFDSYDKNLVLSELLDNVDFVGGYSLHGSRFTASGGENSEASLVFYRKGERFLTASSERIAIYNDKVMASGTSVKIVLHNDSIIHPGLDLRYDPSESVLNLIRDGKGISAAPYQNTYHDLEMDFQTLKWRMDEDEIVFGTIPGNTATPANFESADYYTNNRFDMLMGIDEIHPLLRVQRFLNDNNLSKEFLIQDFVNYSSLQEDQSRRFLMWLAAEGFIIYNSTTGKVYVKDRLERYIAAKSKKRDYDVINFLSQEPKNNKNAVLNLNSMELTINGVNEVYVSDVRDVIAVPRNRKIVVKEGRDFSMSGQLIAGDGGRFRINCESIDFDYEDFKMYFQDATTEIWVPNNQGIYDERGELALERLESEITIANGELLVDTNINKSGIWKDDFPQYPIIRSYDRSKVYYDQAEIFSGVYKRDNFFFEVDPFEIDSLDTYTRESLSFPGDFYSADIFPSFREELRVQIDNALGFVIKSPEEGYPLYNGKGRYHAGNTISLNKSGLRGDGKFDYLTSVTESDDYVFFPDSMNTHANTFELPRTISEYEFPSVSGTAVYEHWRPYQDVLMVQKESENLVMYDAQVYLSGHIYLSPDGLTGGGRTQLDDSELIADLYSFYLDDFESDTADFRLNRSDLDAIAFESINLQTEIDLLQRTGTFKSNGSGSFVSFPENQYICYIDQLKWFMDQNHVELGASEYGDGSKFVSLHPEQDSLSFVSTSAFYSLENYIIEAGGVKVIIVADAEIYPENGDVVVETNALMRTLHNASLLVNRTERYHQLFDATIDVQGRKSYSGNASYHFKGMGLEEQTLNFTSLYIDEEQTIGLGKITEEMNFSFNPQFSYKGDVRLEGSQENLHYHGTYQVQHECSIIENTWVQFSAYIGDKEMRLPIGEEVLDESGLALHIGPIMGEDAVYPSFLSKKVEAEDVVILPLVGELFYDYSKDAFVVEKDSLSNYFSFSNVGCKMNGGGIMNLGLDIGRVEMSNTGDFTYNAMSNTFKINTMLSSDFYMSDKAMAQMGQEFVDDPMADELEMSERFYVPTFSRILGGDDLVFEYEMYGEFERLPRPLNKSIYLYDLSLEWNAEKAAFLSKGMIGLGNSKGYQINKLYKGTVELAKDRSGDELNIYLETDMGDWYYFGYTNELMLSRSSYDDYNLFISEVKTGQKKLPTKKEQTPYQYDLASEDDVDNFKKRFFR